MKTDTILKSLKLKHKQLLRQVNILTGKKESIEKSLASAMAEAVQTEEAILALEGKTSSIKAALESAVAATNFKLKSPLVVPASSPVQGMEAAESSRPAEAENKSLPPAEPGFRWAKNKLGEDVLVAEGRQTPSAYVVPNVFLPPVEEGVTEFVDDPRDLLI